MAAHGLGRLAYKQVVAVMRAAPEPAPSPAVVQDPPDAEDPPGDPAPAVGTTRTDVPPGSWVAAFPAPDLEPTPSPPAPVERAAADETPEQVAAELPRPPRPAPEPQPEPRVIDEPAPTAGDVEGTLAPGQPSPLAPIVAVLIAPIVVGIVPVIPHAPGRPRLGAMPSVRPGGVRVASPRGARR